MSCSQNSSDNTHHPKAHSRCQGLKQEPLWNKKEIQILSQKLRIKKTLPAET